MNNTIKKNEKKKTKHVVVIAMGMFYEIAIKKVE